MRASMNSLSRVHATAFALRRSLGGRKRFLKMFPEVQERKVPRLKTLKALMAERLRPYLEYLAVFHTGEWSTWFDDGAPDRYQNLELFPQI